jgi:hypothetical protein
LKGESKINLLRAIQNAECGIRNEKTGFENNSLVLPLWIC